MTYGQFYLLITWAIYERHSIRICSRINIHQDLPRAQGAIYWVRSFWNVAKNFIDKYKLIPSGVTWDVSWTCLLEGQRIKPPLSAPRHNLNQSWNIFVVDWILGNKFQWNYNPNSNILIQQNALQDVASEMAAICIRLIVLTHWGRGTHICVVKLSIIGSDNGLSPGRRQALIWTNAAILLIGPLGTNFSEILIGIQTFSFKKMHLKMSSAKWRPFCLGLNVLTGIFFWENHVYSQIMWRRT